VGDGRTRDHRPHDHVPSSGGGNEICRQSVNTEGFDGSPRGDLQPGMDRARGRPYPRWALASTCPGGPGESVMKIQLTSIFVGDQSKALSFYTEKLGFLKNHDFPAGKYRWLTVVSPEDPKGVNLVLQPDDNPAASAFQKSLHEQGIPAAMFFVTDIHAEFSRLKLAGVHFTKEPHKVTGSTIAILDDTVGNLIQIAQLDWASG
jgi:predicted enzyme related to lactoylglutathione lyase